MARFCILLLVALSFQFLSFAQDDWDADFDTWETDDSAFVAEEELCESGRVEGPTTEKIVGVTFAIVATLFAGVAVRFPKMHVFRPLMLLFSVAFLGFFLGGCPCPIKGFESLVAVFSGEHIHRLPIILLGGALLLTPFLGSVWCGWVCHLGGLQEFLFRKNLIKQPSQKVSRIFLWVRRVAGISFILWMFITAKSFWEPIDPFRSVFNLIVTNPLSWTLLVVMLLSSLFIYRPFCRTLCPVGMLIGEVNRIPIFAKIRVSENCVNCKRCGEACGMGAIEKGKIDHANCIACGMCMGPCRKSAIELKFKRS